ncbi:MAG: TldD/PmbA family protein, partial [Defluviitaleaceae bacterium]|nr:TldD/PmbA family protein [Defluviitaleaceae bacterium]
MLSKNLAERVLEAAMSTGGGFAEIFAEHTLNNSLMMVNGVLEKAVSGTVYGCGLRLISGRNAVYAFGSDMTEAGLMKLARAVAGAVAQGAGIRPAAFADTVVADSHRVVKLPSGVNKADIADLLRTAHEASSACGEYITQTANSYRDTVQNVLIANSEGLWASDRRVYTRVTVQSVASDAGIKQTGNIGRGAMSGFELMDGVDMADFGRASAETAMTMLRADFAPSGEMPVVIDNGFGGVLFHEACGHSLEGTLVSKGASVMCGKMGERVASDVVTAVDDGTIPGAWGSLNIDDEG